MKRVLFTLSLAASFPAAALAQSDTPTPIELPAQTAAPSHRAPYAKLASELETPDLVDSEGPKDKSLLRLRFVGSGQSDTQWLKMTSISIAKVKPEDTATAAQSIIAKFKAGLENQKHAKIKSFETSTDVPQTAFFEFYAEDGTAEQGIAYSPAPGFVSVIQVAYKHGYLHAAVDRELLKRLLTSK